MTNLALSYIIDECESPRWPENSSGRTLAASTTTPELLNIDTVKIMANTTKTMLLQLNFITEYWKKRVVITTCDDNFLYVNNITIDGL